MQVSIVPTDKVLEWWPAVEYYLSRSADYTYGRYTADDILYSLIHEGRTLWIVFDDETLYGAVVTSLSLYPTRKYVCIEFCGGVEFDSWHADILATLKQWGRDNGCVGLEAIGRAGWAKKLKADGHKPIWQMFELPIE